MTICNEILKMEHLGSKNVCSKESKNIEFPGNKEIWWNVTITTSTKVQHNQPETLLEQNEPRL